MEKRIPKTVDFNRIYLRFHNLYLGLVYLSKKLQSIVPKILPMGDMQDIIAFVVVTSQLKLKSSWN